MSVLLPKNIDVSKIEFATTVKVSDNGSKTVYMSFGKAPIVIQTPRMKATFGMSKFNGGNNGDKDGNKPLTNPDEIEKQSLQLSLKDLESNAAMGKFHDFLKKIDARLVNVGVENSKSWFKKSITQEVLYELYSPQVTYSKDKETGEINEKFPPNFRFSVPVQNGKVLTECFNEAKEKINIATIEKGSSVTAILQCQGVWMAGSKFGCSWKPISLRVTPPEIGFKKFAFHDDDDDTKSIGGSEDFHVITDVDQDASLPASSSIKKAKANLEPELEPESDEDTPVPASIPVPEAVPVPEAIPAAVVAAVPVPVPDAESEDDEADDEDEDVKPPPPPVKKIVAKKK